MAQQTVGRHLDRADLDNNLRPHPMDTAERPASRKRLCAAVAAACRVGKADRDELLAVLVATKPGSNFSILYNEDDVPFRFSISGARQSDLFRLINRVQTLTFDCFLRDMAPRDCPPPTFCGLLRSIQDRQLSDLCSVVTSDRFTIINHISLPKLVGPRSCGRSHGIRVPSRNNDR
jgi:hypothetical protein